MKQDDFGPAMPLERHYEYDKVRTAWLAELNRTLELLNVAESAMRGDISADEKPNYPAELETTCITVLRAIQFASMKDFPSPTNVFAGVDKHAIATAMHQSKKL